MYKVFIVDDEKYVVASLVKSINKAESSFEVIATSNNSMDACNSIIEIMPDLVFTDIRMPGMNGLELIKSVKEALPGTLFIVVSGYAEFAYAQKALEYGALGYCLKPFDDSEISDLLKKAKSLLEKTGLKDEEYDLISFLEEPNNDGYDKINKYFNNKGIDIEKGVVAAASIGCRPIVFDNCMKHIHLKTGNAKHIYFFQHTGESDFKRLFSSKIPDEFKGIGLTGTFQNVENIKTYIEEATSLAFQYFITGRRDLYFKPQIDYKDTESIIRKYEKSTLSLDIYEVKKALNEVKTCIDNGSLTVKQAMSIYNGFISFFNNLDCENYGEYIYSIEELCSSFKDANSMVTQLESMLFDMSNKKHGELKDEIKNKYFKKMLDYVNQNFYTDISIQSLAKVFSINPSYISQLFRKELSMTFTDYITKLRVDYASDLLQKTGYTIEDIANKCGYSDYFYFIKVYKKTTGLTPGQFRSSTHKND